MRFGFKDIEEPKVYSGTLVMFILSKYSWFTNCVVDTLKYIANKEAMKIEVDNDNEFGLDGTDSDNNVDIETFIKVANVKNMSGKWFCRLSLDSATSKQIEMAKEYIKKPSKEGVLIITATEFKNGKDFLNNKILNRSLNEHVITLNYAYEKPLQRIVSTAFSESELMPEKDALELFLKRINTEYDEIPKIISDIKLKNGAGEITVKDMKAYLKDIEYFSMDDLINEVVSVTSDRKKKRLVRIVRYLVDSQGAELVVKQLIKVVDNMIRFRELINNGTVPIKIYAGRRYPFSEVIKNLGDAPEKKLNEHVFYRRIMTASRTSIGDWIQMKFILESALDNSFDGSIIREEQCNRALLAIINRQVYTTSRMDNILKVDNIIEDEVDNIDRIEVDSMNKST